MGYKTTGYVLREKPSIGIEPTRLYDASRNKNHGVHTNITMVQLPKGLWVRSYNGSSSFVDLGSPVSLDKITDAITVGGWFYIDHTAVHGVVSGVISKSDRATANLGWLIALDDRGGAGAINNLQWIGSAGAADNFKADVDDAITVAGWYHIVGTYDKDLGGTEEAKLYLSAVVIATDDYDKAMGENAFSVKIGANHDTGGDGSKEHFAGMNGLTFIRNYALSAGQIKNIFDYENAKWFRV